MKHNTILVVDDMEINRMILEEIFQDSFQVIQAENGKEAIEALTEYKESIVMVLLDIIMPVMDGYQVMEWMNQKKLMSKIAVILITENSSEDMERRAYEIGVSDIIHKPFDAYIVKRRVTNIVELYQHKNKMEEQIERQTRKISEKNTLLREQAEKLQEINDVIIDTMSDMVEFRDLESGQHIKRIKKFSRCLAESVAVQYPEYGLNPKTIKVIEQASAMHDIGKIAIPDSILLKPGKLTAEEFDIMKTHTTKGCEIIQRIAAVQGKEYSKYCYDICRHHHERFDGRGYPDGIKADEIPIAAQIVSVADVYDALISKRVYKSAFALEEAYEMILNGECGVFAPKLMKCLEISKAEFERIVQEGE